MDLSLESWIADFANYGWWEIPAVLSALLYVILAAKKNRWCFLYGLVSSLIYVYLTIRLKLYFDSFINAYYVLMSIVGWINWSSANEKEEIAVVKIGWKKFTLYSFITILLTLVLGWLAEKYTDDALPYWDALTTLFALLGTYWLVKRITENWIIWIIVDLISFVIYLYKGLPLTSLLFFIYSIMAVYGYLQWNKDWRIQPK